MARKKKGDTDNRKALAYLIIPPKGDPRGDIKRAIKSNLPNRKRRAP